MQEFNGVEDLAYHVPNEVFSDKLTVIADLNKITHHQFLTNVEIVFVFVGLEHLGKCAARLGHSHQC
jgi:hypothetical protein